MRRAYSTDDRRERLDISLVVVIDDINNSRNLVTGLEGHLYRGSPVLSIRTAPDLPVDIKVPQRLLYEI